MNWTWSTHGAINANNVLVRKSEKKKLREIVCDGVD
jgi:hypothetical protein